MKEAAEQVGLWAVVTHLQCWVEAGGLAAQPPKQCFAPCSAFPPVPGCYEIGIRKDKEESGSSDDPLLSGH